MLIARREGRRSALPRLSPAEDMKRFRIAILILAFLLVVYCLGYGVSRQSHLIVHITAYSRDTNGHPIYTAHDVVEGDAKFASPNPLIAAFYTPLRYIEVAYWRRAKPVGSSFP
jgi:hypothetical protein